MSLPLRKVSSILVGVAVAGTMNCRDAGITKPQTSESPAPQGLIVSSPMVLPAATAAASAAVRGAERSVVARQDSIAFVSLMPGTAPGGARSSIQNRAKGVTQTVSVIDGGFDPVGIPARVGDIIEVAVTNAAAVVVFQAVVAVSSPHRPLVVRTSPPAKKTDVPLNMIMQVVFSAPIDSTTLTAESVQLLRGTTPVPGTLRFTDSTKIIAEFHPDNLLAASTSYRLVVSQTIRDLNHLALESPVDVEFTTAENSTTPKIVFTVVPTNTTAGVAITPAVAVAIQDASGNTITYANGPVTIGWGNGISAVLSGTTTVNAVNGVATFEDLSIAKAATYSLVASYPVSSPTLTSAPSPAFSVLPATASKLELSGLSSVDATRPFTVGVRISDAFGNTVSSATDSVTVSLASNPGGATLAGTLTVPTLSGVATFANLTLDRPGLGYVLEAISGTLRETLLIDVWSRDAFTAVSAGGAHTCALTHGEELYCWGANTNGQVGVGSTIDYANPVRVAYGSLMTTVSAGGSHTCGIMRLAGVGSTQYPATRLFCWGLNDDGQLGDGTKTTRLGPMPTLESLLPGNVESVITGGSHTCAYYSDPWDYGATPICWGRDVEGQLGGPNGNPPAAVLAAGGAHTCGISWTPPPALYCWGSNKNGQLGAGTVGQFSPLPFRVAAFFGNEAVSAGRSHTCANITVGGTGGLYCWGLNDDGQVGDGTTIQRTSPALVSGGPFTSVTAGGSHTCALNSAGAAYCWGRNNNGQLGDGTTTMRTTPVLVAGGLTFVSLSAGGSHTCGATVRGAYCWGANGNGQLGDGTTTDSAVPVKVSGH
jgi:alpha-tubulin suppressor-like RCC1 family protein